MDEITHISFPSLKKFFIPLSNLKAIHILVLVGFIVYFNMLFNGFAWDDMGFIVLNPEIHKVDLPLLFGKNAFNDFGYYKPITALYFASMYAVFKEFIFFYHIVQLLIHTVNVSFLFVFLSLFFNKKLSLFLALIFLVHPIQVESVSYIGDAVTPIFFLFGITALWLSTKESVSLRRYSAISLLLLLSILTKETGFLFFLLIILYVFIFKRKSILKFLLFIIIPFVFYLIIRFAVVGSIIKKITDVPIGQLTLSERLINIPEIIFYYIKTFFYPDRLVIEQQWIVKSIDFQHFYFPLLIDVLFLLLSVLSGFYIYKNNKSSFKLYIFFFLWLIIGISIHLQIFPLDMTVADRWFYFPMAGLLGILGINICSFKVIHKYIKTIGYIAAIFIIIVLSVRTMVRNTDWKDSLTLYLRDSKIHTNYNTELNLGTEFALINKYDEAIFHYVKSMEIYPYEITAFSLANIYSRINNVPKAKEYYAKIIKGGLKSSNLSEHERVLKESYERYARLLILSDSLDVSKKFIKNALSKYPNSGNLWTYLAVSEYKQHNQDEALYAANKAKTFMPGEKTDLLYLQIKNKKQFEIQ